MIDPLSPPKEYLMFRWIHATSFLVTSLALFAFVGAPGCTPPKDANKQKEKEKEKQKEKEKEKDKAAHEHSDVGPHGGPLADWADVFHGEFTADPANKMVVVYILDDKAKYAPDVEPSRFSKVKLNIPSEKISLELTHDAKKSGKDGIAFTATHDFFGKPTAFKGNLSVVVDENDKAKTKRFSDDFEYDPKKAKK
jgi:maltose-binding protein MalE